MVIVPTDIYGGAETGKSHPAANTSLHAFVTTAALATVDPAGLDEFRHVVVGGETLLPPHLVGLWAPGREFVNAYGPTETTVMADISEPMTGGRTHHDRWTDPRRARDDPRFAPATPYPLGAPGELYIAGIGLARGYHRRPRPDPASDLSPTPSASQATGCTARATSSSWRSDHTIEYVGRSDFQVKIRGFRIELGEVDAQITAMASVTNCVTLGVDGPGRRHSSRVLPHPSRKDRR